MKMLKYLIFNILLYCIVVQIPKSSNGKFTGKSNFDSRNESSPRNYNERLLKIMQRREPTAWRFNYIQEFLPSQKELLVVEKSLDERLANSAYTSLTSRTNIDFEQFNSGQKDVDELNRQLVAGPQVNDSLCAEQVHQMLVILRELEEALEYKRSHNNEPLYLKERHIHLGKVLESFGRYESGFFAGRLSSTGSYRQCVASNLLLEDENEVKNFVGMRFCWAKLRIDKHLDEQLRQRQGTAYETSDLSIISGICLPESCHTKSFAMIQQTLEQLIHSQFTLPQSLYVDKTLELKSIFCSPDEDSNFRMPFSGRLLVCFASAWLVLALFATLYRNYISKDSNQADDKNQVTRESIWRVVMKSLDLYQSAREFLMLDKQAVSAKQQVTKEVDQNDRPTKFQAAPQLSNLTPVKVLGTAYVVMGHAVLLLWNISNNFLEASTLYQTDRTLLPMMVGVFVVDSFFVISGLLLCYGILNKIDHMDKAILADRQQEQQQPQQQQQRSNFSGLRLSAKIILSRYARLVPMFMLVFWFNKGIFNYLNTGMPYADFGFNKLTVYGACQHLDSWWTPISFLSAWIPMTSLCIPQAWSVSCDLFYNLMVVPLSILLAKRARLALGLIGLICVATLLNAWIAYTEANPMLKVEVIESYAQGITYLLNDFSYLYTLPHYRATTILLGVLAGYLLYQEQKQLMSINSCNEINPNDKKTKSYIDLVMRISRSNLVTILALGVAAQPFVLAYYMPEVRKHVALEDREKSFEQTNVIHRFLWSLSNALLFIRMVTEWQDSPIMKMSRSKFWKVLVKLDYIILLIHMDVLELAMWSPTSSRLFSKWRAVYDFIACYSICLPLAMLLYIVFENPTNKLLRKLLQPNN